MKKLAILFITLMLPFLSMAHGYWLETKGSGKIGEPATVLLFFGEYGAGIREKGTKLDKMADIKVSVIDASGSKLAIQMKQTDTHWEGTFIPQKEGNYQILGINDTREVQDWTKHKLGITRPVQFLRTNYMVGTSQNSENIVTQYLDIITQRDGDLVTVSILKNNQPFAKTSVTIVNPQTWEKKQITNQEGKTTFTLVGKGLYLIETEWIDTTKGIFNGKEYETIRYKSETTLII